MKNSIDLTRIRSIKILNGMKKDLEFFIREEEVRNIYLNDNDWSEDDLAGDREDAASLIERIDLRLLSLKNMNSNHPKEKVKLNKKKSSENESVIANDVSMLESNTSSIISLL